MIAARLTMLAVAASLVLAALGATDFQRPAQLVVITAVTGLMAPLFWPGCAATPSGTTVRIAGWSSAAVVLAAVGALVAGGRGLPLARIATACAVLLLILLVTHAFAAGLEMLLRSRAGDSDSAREVAGRTAAVVLAILGSLPLWLGPAAELAADRHAWIIDATLGVSPLTHLAVASGNDLLRNQWFYQHSNLAALQFSYPGLAELTAAYASLSLVLVLVPLAFLRRRHPIDGPGPTYPTTEQTQ